MGPIYLVDDLARKLKALPLKYTRIDSVGDLIDG
jgi:hypothetical protein